MDIAFESSEKASGSYLCAVPRRAPNPDNVFKHNMPLYNSVRLLKIMNTVYSLPHVSGMELEALAKACAESAVSQDGGRPWIKDDGKALYSETVRRTLRCICSAAPQTAPVSKLRSVEWLGASCEVLGIVERRWA